MKRVKDTINEQDFQTIRQIADVYKRWEITDGGLVKIFLGNCEVLLGKTDKGYRVAAVKKIEDGSGKQ